MELATVKELVGFLREHKKLWLLPIILVVLFIGVVAVVTTMPSVAPVIYTLF